MIVPSPPRFLLDRLKFLENHIVRLEKEFPPWAALHFNQPNRGVSALVYTYPFHIHGLKQWPPPPRSTPIIVPAHMRLPTKGTPALPAEPVIVVTEAKAGKPKFRKSRSSLHGLHHAVMEHLEVQQAMGC